LPAALGTENIIGSNTGITAGQIKTLFQVIEKTVGKERGETARTVISTIEK